MPKKSNLLDSTPYAHAFCAMSSGFKNALVKADEAAGEAASAAKEAAKEGVQAADEWAGDKAEALSGWVEQAILKVRRSLDSLAALPCMARDGGRMPAPEKPPPPEPARYDEEELNEAVICAIKGAPCSQPWHPSQQPVFKLCLIGPPGTGKSALVRRAISRSYEERYEPTSVVRQHFWRHQAENQHGQPGLAGLRTQDLLVELEDCPGIAADAEGEPTADGSRVLEALLPPLVWYEARRREVAPPPLLRPTPVPPPAPRPPPTPPPPDEATLPPGFPRASPGRRGRARPAQGRPLGAAARAAPALA